MNLVHLHEHRIEFKTYLSYYIYVRYQLPHFELHKTFI